MTNDSTPPTTPKRDQIDATFPRSSGEFHCHGDPVLEAILKHDTALDQAERQTALKELYEQHARMVEHQRTGTFLGDHTMWYAQDYLPKHSLSETK
jgi:hypothetical protein